MAPPAKQGNVDHIQCEGYRAAIFDKLHGKVSIWVAVLLVGICSAISGYAIAQARECTNQGTEIRIDQGRLGKDVEYIKKAVDEIRDEIKHGGRP